MADTNMEDEDFTGHEGNNGQDDYGWQVVAGRRSRASTKAVDEESTLPRNQREHGVKKTAVVGMVKNRIIKASRMPQLPEEHRKIIIRPRGGLNLNKVSTTTIGSAVIERPA